MIIVIICGYVVPQGRGVYLSIDWHYPRAQQSTQSGPTLQQPPSYLQRVKTANYIFTPVALVDVQANFPVRKRPARVAHEQTHLKEPYDRPRLNCRAHHEISVIRHFVPNPKGFAICNVDGKRRRSPKRSRELRSFCGLPRSCPPKRYPFLVAQSGSVRIRYICLLSECEQSYLGRYVITSPFLRENCCER